MERLIAIAVSRKLSIALQMALCASMPGPPRCEIALTPRVSPSAATGAAPG
jgi:hypothetical protein